MVEVTTHSIIMLSPGPHPGFDFGAYKRAAVASSAEFMIFMNHYSRPLVKEWDRHLLAAAQLPDVGIAGCTGSHEGIEGSPFPNEHIRTNAFCMRRELFLSLDLPEPKCKRDASLLEAGPNSLTRQILASGMRSVVVDSDGYRRDLIAARDSATFRWGKQSRLLVADNRTDHYANGSPEERRYLQRLAWGENE